MKTAIVVPVLNEMVGLAELCRRLLDQASPEDEIIFVDAGSHDGTAEFLDCQAFRHPRIRFLQSPGAFPGKGRNVGIASTDAPLVVQIDGGTLPTEGWLEALRAPVLRGEADYAMGDSKIMPMWRTWLGRRFDLGAILGAIAIRGDVIRDAPPPPAPGETIDWNEHMAGGHGICYRREFWERVGGFPDWLRAGEDQLFVRKVTRLTDRFQFVPGSLLYWHLVASPSAIFTRRFQRQLSLMRTPAHLRAHLRTLLPYFLWPLLLAAGLLWPWLAGLAWLAMATALATWAMQTAKTLRTLKRRPHPEHPGGRLSPFEWIMALLLTPPLEALGLAARVWGTWKGLVLLPRVRKEWEDRVTAYLEA